MYQFLSKRHKTEQEETIYLKAEQKIYLNTICVKEDLSKNRAKETIEGFTIINRRFSTANNTAIASKPFSTASEFPGVR